ncbi:MAG: disulfide bond formation protein DsbA [Nitrosopumilus sp. B06]|nr:MAG: disulfide bond formation protein DsbA [Nitrosopumilus sp. D6]RNJ80698.1 MAG: disulfide bond formation protein DsbA [Nitrosopumilus sp. B06]
MAWLYLTVPVIVGLAAGIFLAAYPNQETQTLTATRLAEGGSPILGDAGAPITILEWGDYQCTFCFKFHQSTLEALEGYIEDGRARLVFKDFPLNGPDSVLAAEASYCAHDQGRYWEYHDELYENWGGEKTGWITREALGGFASVIGLNLDEFDGCLDGQKHRKKVLALYEFGREIGINATPSFLVFNGEKIVKIVGNQPLQVFLRTLEEL